MNNQNIDVFKKRKITFTLIFIIAAAITVASSIKTEYKFVDGITSIPSALVWIGKNLIPTQESLKKLPKILDKLMETVLLSVAVTVIAAVFAFVFSLFGSKTTKVNSILSRIVRIIAAFFRNVPDVVWAILLMFSFGQNILTGFFALFFTTFGLLTRAFIETIDEVSSSCVEALVVTGASYIQTVFQGIIPSSVVGIITWVLYMIETNIRSSTLVGMLTSTGIGYLFDLYYKRLDFSSAGLVVLSIIILVILIELLSNKLRKIIM
jgi:phosphonate transport system permease protein